jgi:hypothetical protein
MMRNALSEYCHVSSLSIHSIIRFQVALHGILGFFSRGLIMSGLIFFAVIGLWIFLVSKFQGRFFHWLGWSKKSVKYWVASPLLFVIVFFLPIGDEIIGGVQFLYVCKRNDVEGVYIDPDKIRGKVVEEEWQRDGFVPWTMVSIRKTKVSYKDIETGEVYAYVIRYRAGHGWLQRWLGWGSTATFVTGQSASCYPEFPVEEMAKRYDFSIHEN